MFSEVCSFARDLFGQTSSHSKLRLSNPQHWQKYAQRKPELRPNPRSLLTSRQADLPRHCNRCTFLLERDGERYSLVSCPTCSLIHRELCQSILAAPIRHFCADDLLSLCAWDCRSHSVPLRCIRFPGSVAWLTQLQDCSSFSSTSPFVAGSPILHLSSVSVPLHPVVLCCPP